jgi:hypothetical protein
LRDWLRSGPHAAGGALYATGADLLAGRQLAPLDVLEHYARDELRGFTVVVEQHNDVLQASVLVDGRLVLVDVPTAAVARDHETARAVVLELRGRVMEGARFAPGG